MFFFFLLEKLQWFDVNDTSFTFPYGNIEIHANTLFETVSVSWLELRQAPGSFTLLSFHHFYIPLFGLLSGCKVQNHLSLGCRRHPDTCQYLCGTLMSEERTVLHSYFVIQLVIRFLPSLVNVSLSFQRILKPRKMLLSAPQLEEDKMMLQNESLETGEIWPGFPQRTSRRFSEWYMKLRVYKVKRYLYISNLEDIVSISHKLPSKVCFESGYASYLFLVRVHYIDVVKATARGCQNEVLSVFDGPKDIPVFHMSGSCENGDICMRPTQINWSLLCTVELNCKTVGLAALSGTCQYR